MSSSLEPLMLIDFCRGSKFSRWRDLEDRTGWVPLLSKAVCTVSHGKTSHVFSVDQEPVRRSFTWSHIIKMGRTILLERRQSESVGRRNSRTTFLRSDWPRPFARREVGVEMELGRSENKRPEQRRS
ncbi:hypothetical protein TNCV_4924251 [Trichonephila clavipes]|nr:hypothetical protein TNCV_4924251 [Trichonephila clavipes]